MSDVLRLALRRRGNRRASEASPDFDWQSYKAHHRDLGPLGDEASARAHYLEHGRGEGRLGSAAAIRARIADLEAAHGPLPADFAWIDYIETNPDLDHITASYDAIAHYLTRGRDEGRLHRRFDADLYRSLYFPGAAMPAEALGAHFKEIGAPAGHVASLRHLAALEKIDQYQWLERLDVAEFDLLNGSWAGPVGNKRDALRAMVREGFERIAPIAFALDFDPDYYAEANPGLAGRRPADRYRHWLFEGMGTGRPGDAIDHLSRHGLALSRFPEGFDWETYRGLGGVHGDSRWAFLDHVVANNALPADSLPVRREGASAFLAALAATICQRLSRRGTDLYAAAARHGSLPPTDHARWADGLVRQGRWAEALDRYDRALEGGDADVGTVVAATRACLEAGAHGRAIGILAASRTRVGGDVRWRQTVREAIQAAFDDAWARAEADFAAGRRQAGDARMTGIVADVAGWWASLDPLGHPLPPDPARRTVMLANVDLRQCTHYRVEQKQEIFAAAGLALEVYSQAEVDAFLTALPGGGGRRVLSPAGDADERARDRGLPGAWHPELLRHRRHDLRSRPLPRAARDLWGVGERCLPPFPRNGRAVVPGRDGAL